MRSPLGFLIAVVGVLIVGFIILYGRWYIAGDASLPPYTLDTLHVLGGEALRSKDVPVAAVLLYGDSVIGAGYNTVVRDGNAGGHAEINAISDAIGRIGMQSFRTLNRDSLLLVSTFEPCMMCRGAFLEYNISRVVFLKHKPLTHWMREEWRTMRYLWERRQATGEAVQDSLFRLHPDYKPPR